MDETLLLVSANGLGGTAVVEIEQAAGLSPGSGAFYRHFPSKLAAVKAAVEREAARLESRRSELAGGDDGGHATGSKTGAGTRAGAAASVAAEILNDMRLLDEFDSLLSITLRDSKHLPGVAAEINHLSDRGETPVGYDNIVRAAEHSGRDPRVVAALVQAADIGLHVLEKASESSLKGVNREEVAKILADMVVSRSSKR